MHADLDQKFVDSDSNTLNLQICEFGVPPVQQYAIKRVKQSSNTVPIL